MLPLVCFLAAVLGPSAAMHTPEARAAVAKDVAPEPKVVKNLDLTKYRGRWYQMYASPSVYSTFERNAKCVTADYTIENVDALDNPKKVRIGVYNHMQDKDTNAERDIKGVAKVAAPSKLNVDFGDAGGPPSTEPSNYWVMALGPEAQGEYQWALVGNRDKSVLYVLARNQKTFGKKYGKGVLAKAKALGFTTADNKPVATVHDKSCKYPAVEELNIDQLLALASTKPPPPAAPTGELSPEAILALGEEFAATKTTKPTPTGGLPPAAILALGEDAAASTKKPTKEEELSPEAILALGAELEGSASKKPKPTSDHSKLSPEAILALGEEFAATKTTKPTAKATGTKKPKATGTKKPKPTAAKVKEGELSPEMILALGESFKNTNKPKDGELSSEAILALGEYYLDQSNKKPTKPKPKDTGDLSPEALLALGEYFSSLGSKQTKDLTSDQIVALGQLFLEKEKEGDKKAKTTASAS